MRLASLGMRNEISVLESTKANDSSYATVPTFEIIMKEIKANFSRY
jgi:hypothetical protein